MCVRGCVCEIETVGWGEVVCFGGCMCVGFVFGIWAEE